MVLLWKHNNNNVKGIIIFTHKELSKKFINYYTLKKKYIIGVHIGCWFQCSIPDYVDFIMSSPNQLLSKNDIKVKIIPYNSRNFLPIYFDKYNNKSIKTIINSINELHKYSKYPLPDNLINNIHNIKFNNNIKYWDIITVAKPCYVKKLDCFLYSIKQIFDLGRYIKILIISPVSPNEYKSPNEFHNIIEIIYNYFTPEQQQYITLFRPDTGCNEGVDNKYLYPFYQWSKIFCFYTEFEGESRVTHEALCCGLPVVCYKYLKGGAKDYLNINNSIQFENYDSAYLSILECIDNYLCLNQNYKLLHNKLHCNNTINLIKDEFKNIYKSFDGNLIDYDNLHFRLPAHSTEKWSHMSDNETSDIMNEEQWNIFCDMYNI